jgi:glycosyltransferase involved in cell wall biosynthesis
MTPQIVLLRGTAANPWELRPWERLHDEGFAQVRVVVPPDNLYDVASLRLETVSVRTVGGLMPPGPPGQLLLRAVGQRHLRLATALENADIVHAAEIGYWFSRQAARLKDRLGYRLVLTVWETLPFVDAYRNVRTRRYRREVLAAADLFLAATERAAEALVLEGAPLDRVRVNAPGIDVERFAAASGAAEDGGGGHVVLSIGRLVWEKGHQDVLRALALLDRRGVRDVRTVIVGSGPEERRLRAVARDLGVSDRVELRGFVPHDELPQLLGRASCVVLASLPTPHWEEQFGMVLAEAMAARLPVVAAASGAIPEVLAGYGALFPPGDWAGLADALAAGPLAAAPGARAESEAAALERYSAVAAATRLRQAYGELLGA